MTCPPTSGSRGGPELQTNLPDGYRLSKVRYNKNIMSKLIRICPDFPEWPKRWKGTEQALEYGEHLLEEMRPFAEFLAESSLAKKTIKRHLDNLWLLGGEIVRGVALYENHSVPASKLLQQAVGFDGGPYCRHLDSETELKSFDNTCRKLHNFLKENKS